MTTFSQKEACRWQQQEMSVIRATSLSVLFFSSSPNANKHTNTVSQSDTHLRTASRKKLNQILTDVSHYCYLSLSSSFLRSCMSLCTTLSTCSASSLLRPERSSLRPITASESRVKMLEPQMVVLKYFQAKAWRSLRNKREIKVILYSIGQSFL